MATELRAWAKSLKLKTVPPICMPNKRSLKHRSALKTEVDVVWVRELSLRAEGKFEVSRARPLEVRLSTPYGVFSGSSATFYNIKIHVEFRSSTWLAQDAEISICRR